MPVATESTQEYRELRELLDTGSAGGGPTVEEAERKQALMVFGGAAAVVLLVIIGLVALPKADDKGGGSKAAAKDTQATGQGSASTEETSTTATTVAPIATPDGLSSFQYQVPSDNILPGLKAGDRVDFYNGTELLAQSILVQSLGTESEALPGFKMRSLTIAATPEEMLRLNAATAKSKRSMATGTAPAPATTTSPPPG